MGEGGRSPDALALRGGPRRRMAARIVATINPARLARPDRTTGPWRGLQITDNVAGTPDDTSIVEVGATRLVPGGGVGAQQERSRFVREVVAGTTSARCDSGTANCGTYFALHRSASSARPPLARQPTTITSQNGGSARGRLTVFQLRSVSGAVANMVPKPQRSIGRVGASDIMLIERFRSVLTERRREIAK
jgi:hypothetical protein